MEREEAINLIKQVLPCLNIDEKIREGFVTLIPELKESEDERIRKELLEEIEFIIPHDDETDSEGLILPSYHARIDRYKSYLEKQKEQKPIFKKGDKVIWDDEEFNILDVNETEYNVGGYRVPFSRQNELHPIWQKSAEWSDDYNEENLQIRFAFYTYKDDPSVIYLSNVFVEETSRNHGLGTRILKAAEKAAEAIGAITIRLKVKRDNPANAWYRKHGYNYLTSEGDYDWLEKNLEYMKPNKQEWSEEDEEMLNSCISSIEEAKENRYAYKETDGDTSYDHEIAWLKSLRNRVGKEFLQPHWKPSEEQMKALKDAFRKDGCNEYRKVINSLYNDLQKLL